MGRLQSLIKGSSPTACLEVLSYFIAKLSSSQLTIRQLSLKVNNLEHYKFSVTIDNTILPWMCYILYWLFQVHVHVSFSNIEPFACVYLTMDCHLFLFFAIGTPGSIGY